MESMKGRIMSRLQTSSGWIGVDLDGTLAFYDVWRGPTHIGRPIPEMVARVKKWLTEGRTVKIFTARASDPQYIPVIQDYLVSIGLPKLDVTNVKDMSMVELWDDRAVRVIPNSGKPCCSTD